MLQSRGGRGEVDQTIFQAQFGWACTTSTCLNNFRSIFISFFKIKISKILGLSFSLGCFSTLKNVDMGLTKSGGPFYSVASEGYEEYSFI